jgi:hypothetical protein
LPIRTYIALYPIRPLPYLHTACTPIPARDSVHNDNVHNFNESGFQIGVISIIKVITGSERRVRPNLI